MSSPRLSYQQLYRLAHREEIIAYNKQYNIDHKEEIRANKKAYSKTHREQINSYDRTYRKKHRAKISQQERDNIQRRLKKNLRSRIRDALIDKTQSTSTLELLGCSMEEFRFHLSAYFHEDARTGEQMSWNNYGLRGWHIDHIIPCSKFDLSDLEQQRKCFHWTNLQPLWWWENLEKRLEDLKS